MGKELVKTDGSIFDLVLATKSCVDIRTPKQFVRKLPNGFDYVEVGYLRRLLVKFCEMNNLIWSVEVEVISTWEMICQTRQVVSQVRLTLTDCKHNHVIREFYGGTSVKYLNKNCANHTKYDYKCGDCKGMPKLPENIVDLGNDFKSAEADGFKKCISSFGMAQDIYEPKVQERVDRAPGREANPQATNPIAPEEGNDGGPEWSNPDDDANLARELGRTIISKELQALLRALENRGLHTKAASNFTKKHFNKSMLKELTKGQWLQTLDWIGQQPVKKK